MLLHLVGVSALSRRERGRRPRRERSRPGDRKDGICQVCGACLSRPGGRFHVVPDRTPTRARRASGLTLASPVGLHTINHQRSPQRPESASARYARAAEEEGGMTDASVLREW